MHSSVMQFELERNEKASSFSIPICSETNAIKPMPFFIKHLNKFAKIQTFFVSDWVPSLTKKFLQKKLKMLGPSLWEDYSEKKT